SQVSPPPIAVIPHYGLRLLEGCGSVKPGNLKVIGKTEPVPFIALFVSESMGNEKEEKIRKALVNVNGDTKWLKALESRDGFKLIRGERTASAGPDWPDWRGTSRDGHVPHLPAQLPARPNYVWKKAAMPGGLAGLTISGERLI